MLDALEQPRVAPEEVLTYVGAVAGLERLVLAVDALLHHPHQRPVGVGGQERVPARSPHDLDHVPPGAAELCLEVLDDLAVAADRAVEALQVAVDDPDQVVELLAAGETDRAHRLGLVHLAVAAKRPHLAASGVGHAARLQVFHEPRLVDRGDRPDPERHRRELPEVGHQPRMRIRGQAVAADLPAKAIELLGAQPPLQERSRVVARRRMPLEIDEIAGMILAGGAPEVVEADLVQRRQRLVAGDVTAELRGLLVGADDHRHRVPAHDRAQPPLHRGVAGQLRFALGRDRVDIRRVEARDRPGAGVLRALDDAGQQLASPVGAIVRHDRVQRLDPLARLDGVDIGSVAGRDGVVDKIGHRFASVWLRYSRGGGLSSVLSTVIACPSRGMTSASRPNWLARNGAR